MTICPICKSAAEAIGTGYSEGKTFRCQKHGDFDVSERVLDTPVFINASLDEWEAALKTASEQAINGKRPRIVGYDFHDLPLEASSGASRPRRSGAPQQLADS